MNTRYLLLSLGMDCPIIAPEPINTPPWAAKTYGKKRHGGSSLDSRGKSPKLRKTRFGTYKSKRD